MLHSIQLEKPEFQNDYLRKCDRMPNEVRLPWKLCQKSRTLHRGQWYDIMQKEG